MQPLTKQHYFAFLLDAIERYKTQGHTIERSRHLLSLLGINNRNKPWPQFLPAVARQMNKQNQSKTLESGLIAEFGVHKANSINLLAKLFPDETIYGFDSFCGFPDDGRSDWNRDFALEKLPDVAENVKLIKGFFDASLPPFDKNLGAELPAKLLHVDCDLYSSTRTIFETLSQRLKPGTVIIFDELINYNRFIENEFLALYEMLLANGLAFKWFVKIGRIVDLETFCDSNNDGFIKKNRAKGFYQCASIRLVKAGDMEQRLEKFADKALRLAENDRNEQKLSPTYADETKS